MKKMLSVLLACLILVTLLAGCRAAQDTNPEPAPATVPASTPAPAENAEIVDGRFVETRSITVTVFDRANDGGTPPEDNFYTNFIKEGMLRDHNIEVTFVPIPRWTEVEALNNLLAAGDAPDIGLTFSFPTIQTYANMGGVIDLAPYLEKHEELLPNLWALLGEQNIFWNKDPQTGRIWAIEALLFHNKRTNTFVREDWLKKLNISEPKTLDEFQAMLEAFRDNASTLLGADADKMIPFSISFDVGWRADHLLTSFVPNDLSDKDTFVYGFDDRRLLFPGIKEGVRELNEWYNAGLIWKDFPLYGAGDQTEDDLIKAGHVGAFIHNWDYPYRGGDNSIHANLMRLVGPNAGFIAVEPFKNDAGVYKKFLSPPIDRKLFFPVTNDEPLASLLYLDWISKFENRNFLQIGEAGINHEVLADGSVRAMASPGERIFNSPSNIDYTITINGLDMGESALTLRSLANGYAGVDARFIERAFAISSNQGRVGINANVGEIKSELGMGPALSEKRNNLLIQSVVADPAQFDSVFDAGMQDYLNSGGQAIIDERRAAWERVYE